MDIEKQAQLMHLKTIFITEKKNPIGLKQSNCMATGSGIWLITAEDT